MWGSQECGWREEGEPRVFLTLSSLLCQAGEKDGWSWLGEVLAWKRI